MLWYTWPFFLSSASTLEERPNSLNISRTIFKEALAITENLHGVVRKAAMVETRDNLYETNISGLASKRLIVWSASVNSEIIAGFQSKAADLSLSLQKFTWEILPYRRISYPSCRLIVDVILANSSIFCFELLVFCFHKAFFSLAVSL